MICVITWANLLWENFPLTSNLVTEAAVQNLIDEEKPDKCDLLFCIFFFPSLAKDKSIGCAKKRKYLLKKTSAKSWKLQRLLTNKWVWDFWRRQTWKDKSINNRLKMTAKKYVYSDTTLKEMILKILTVYVYILNASLNTSFRI